MKATYYTIIQVPDRVQYTCPYCDCEDDEKWEEFTERSHEEYGAWAGDLTLDTVECTGCGRTFMLDEVEVD